MNSKTKEIIEVGHLFYVIPDRTMKPPELIEAKDPKVIALRKREGRTAYATCIVDHNSIFAEGPFESYTAAETFIKNKERT